MKATPKPAKKNAAPRARSKRVTVPRGLSHLLALIDYGIQEDALYALAQRAVRDLDNWRSGNRNITPMEAVGALFPSMKEPPDEHTVFECGIQVGAAVAWLVMADLTRGEP